MRPTGDVLDDFYGLAELNSDARRKAVAALLIKTRSDKSVRDYCVERLISGLSSSRAAARIGYSTTLGLLLADAYKEWSIEKLLELADAKLDLKNKERASASAIGHHLLVSAIVSSDHYNNDIKKILEHELMILRQFSFLSMSITQTIACMCLRLDQKNFKTMALPQIKDYIEGALQLTQPEWVYLTFLLKEKFAAVIHEHVPFLTKTGSVQFTNEHYGLLYNTLKKCDKSCVKSLISLLIAAAREADQFDAMYKNVVEKWALSDDESKVIDRLFEMAMISLTGGTKNEEVLAIFSPNMLKRINTGAKSKGAQQRFLKTRVVALCSFLESRVSLADSGSALEIVEALDKMGNLDQLTGSKLTSHFISKFDEAAVAKWVKSATDDWSFRRVVSAFATWSSQAKLVALTQLVSRPKSNAILNVVANCIDTMFSVKVRASESVSINLSEENESVLRSLMETMLGKDVVKKAVKVLGTGDNTKQSLPVLWMCLKLWAALASDDEAATYEGCVEELFVIKKQIEAGEEGNNKVLIDLLMGLLSQTHKYHKTIVYFVYVSLLPELKSDDVTHIVESLMMNDAELSGEGTSSDVEDGDDEDQEEQEETDEGDEGSEEEEEDEAASESDSDLDEVGEVDQALVSRLQSALGKAAVKKNGAVEDVASESESDLSEVDDEEMYAMDERLAAAFKASSSIGKGSAYAVQAFRSKLTDLLLFTLSSANTKTDVKLTLIVPLIQLTKVQMKRSTDGPSAKKTIDLLSVVANIKKLSVSEKKVLKILPHLVTEASSVSNPSLTEAIASVLAFLFSIARKDGVASDSLRAAYVDLFNQFMNQEDGIIVSTLAMAAIVKYPTLFVPDTATIINAAFDETKRIFRRTEALLCAVPLLSKQTAMVAPVDKSVLKSIGKHLSTYLESVAENSTEVKPRFFACALKMMMTVANSSEEAQTVLQKSLLPVVESLIDKEELWKAGGTLKKCNAACTLVCGKQPLHVLKNVAKSLS